MASSDSVQHVEVIEGVVGKLIVSKDGYPAGSTMTESICSASEVLPSPTVYTVQVAPDQHVDVKAPLMFTAHSCEPSGKIVVKQNDGGGWTVQVESIREVKKGDWVTFDYNTTEWDMQSPFDCACGSATCRKRIKGAKHLSKADAETLLPRCSGVIAAQLRASTLAA
jgi:hypothetical protein